eukprot:3595904-Prymnesium_polylepis.1
MGMELDPPFESDLEYEKPSRQAVTAGFSQLDFFCQVCARRRRRRGGTRDTCVAGRVVRCRACS